MIGGALLTSALIAWGIVISLGLAWIYASQLTARRWKERQRRRAIEREVRRGH